MTTAATPAESTPSPAAQSSPYDDAIVRRFLTATAVWGFITLAAGLFLSLELVHPRLTAGIPELAYGRLRPLVSNLAAFAFAANAAFAGIYYSTQRLCNSRLFSDTLSGLHFWGWQLLLLAAVITLPRGLSQGKEYAELARPLDLALLVIWTLFATNFFRTLARRNESRMYVSLWFYIATIVIFPIAYALNSLPSFAGLRDAAVQSWSTHNSVGLLLAMPFLGLLHYLIPKAADRPLHSYPLAVVTFWSMLILYPWAGPSPLSPLPDWLGSLGMLASLLLVVPAAGAVFNNLATLRGTRHAADPVVRFLAAGLIFYILTSLASAALACKSLDAFARFTDWSVDHAPVWTAFLTFGMTYWLLPRLFQSPLWSPRLAKLHFWLALIGTLIQLLALFAAGLTQGIMWRAFDDLGKLLYPDFVDSVAVVKPLYSLRAFGGAIALVGAGLGVLNLVMTWRTRPASLSAPPIDATPLPSAHHEPREPASRLSSVVDVGHAADRFAQGWWHRRLERLPTRLAIVTLAALTVPLVAEVLIPLRPAPNPMVRPYSDLELAGRGIYIAEGCASCHSQLVRPIWAETSRYGRYSEPGEFAHDQPVLWGSRRIGPDLSREGGARSHDWHIRHLADPRELIPLSVMPSFAHLLREPLAAASDQARAQAAHIAAELTAQGGPPNLHNTKAIALLAYLQRLGQNATPAGAGP